MWQGDDGGTTGGGFLTTRLNTKKLKTVPKKVAISPGAHRHRRWHAIPQRHDINVRRLVI